MASFEMNNVTYSGSNMIIINNRVIIDGKDQTPNAKEIIITVTGDVSNLNVDYAKEVTVIGNVHNLKTTSGDVDCKDITGDVNTTSGDIECGNIGGSINTTSGDVSADIINGSVKTVSGNIKTKK